MRKIKNIIYYTFPLITLLPKSASAMCGLGEFDDLVFGGGCISSYQQWINLVWNYGLSIAIPLSLVILIYAGILYSASGGSPDRIGKAKKMIIGVFSGLGVLILGKVFIVLFLGVPSDVSNLNTTTPTNYTSPSGAGGGTSTGGGDGGGGGGGGAD